MNQFNQKLEQIANLPDNWDGYGACIIPEKVLENTETVLEKVIFTEKELLEDLDMYPNPNGTISFIYDKNNYIMNLEIGTINHSLYISKNNEVLIYKNEEIHNYTYRSLKIYIRKYILNKYS